MRKTILFGIVLLMLSSLVSAATVTDTVDVTYSNDCNNCENTQFGYRIVAKADSYLDDVRINSDSDVHTIDVYFVANGSLWFTVTNGTFSDGQAGGTIHITRPQEDRKLVAGAYYDILSWKGSGVSYDMAYEGKASGECTSFPHTRTNINVTTQVRGSSGAVDNCGNIDSFTTTTAEAPGPTFDPRKETIFYTSLVNETQNHSISVLLQNYNITSASTANLVYRNRVYDTTINFTNDTHVRFHGFPLSPLVFSNNTNQTFFFNYTLPHNATYTETNLSGNLSHRIQWAYIVSGTNIFGGIETLKQDMNVTEASAHIASTELIASYNGTKVTEIESKPYGFLMNFTSSLHNVNNTQVYGNATLNVSYSYYNQYGYVRTSTSFNHWVLWIAWLKNATVTPSVETTSATESCWIERHEGNTLLFTPQLNYLYDGTSQPNSYSNDLFSVTTTAPLVQVNHTNKNAVAILNLTYGGITKLRPLIQNTTPINRSVDWGYYITNSSTLRNITETLSQTALTTILTQSNALLNLNYIYNKTFTASTNTSNTFSTVIVAPKVSTATVINYTVNLNVTFGGLTFERNFTYT